MIRFRTLLAGLLAAGCSSWRWLSAVCGAPSGRLMVYTSQPSDQMAKVVEAFRKTHPDIRIELFRSGTTEVHEQAAGRARGRAPAGRRRSDRRCRRDDAAQERRPAAELPGRARPARCRRR